MTLIELLPSATRSSPAWKSARGSWWVQMRSIGRARLHQPDRGRPGVRAEVRAAHVEGLVVADDAPVDGDRRRQRRRTRRTAELAQQPQPLGDGRRVAGRLEVHVGAVAVGELPHDRVGVVAADVDRDVRAARSASSSFARRGPGRRHRRHFAPRRRSCRARSARSRRRRPRPRTGCGALHGVQRARQRLGERGVRGRDFGHLVHEGLGGNIMYCAIPPGVRSAEAVDVVRGAHPVLAAAAVPALPARHDLFGDDPVADLARPSGGPRSSSWTISPTNSWPGMTCGSAQAARGVAPELRRAVVALEVAGADADGLDLDEGLTGSRDGHGDLFEAVVVGP